MNKHLPHLLAFLLLIFSANSNAQLLVSSLDEYLEDGVWQVERDATYEYDSLNRLSRMVLHRTPLEGNRTVLGEWVYTYDQSGNRISIYGNRFYPQTNSFQVEFRYMYSYNNKNQLELEEYQRFEQNQWVNYYKWLYEYNVIDSVSISTRQSWSASTGWVNYYKNHLEYNDDKQLVADTTFSWNSNDGAWIKSELFLNNYTNEALISDTLFNWSVNNWNYAYSTDYDYNDTLLIKKEESRWDYNLASWKKDYAQEYVYNTSADLFQIFGKRWVDSTNNWSEIINRETFNYSYPTSVIPFITTPVINIYPNPAAESINISIPVEAVVIIGADGKELFRDNNYVGNSIDIRLLKPGFYFLNIKSKGKSSIHRFIIE